MADCFIIMPITTPESMLSKYSDDRDHFRHVLDHLIVPSVKKAKLNPVPPVASGSEVIHGKIIEHIETSDLVLCDMSILNPNVFFELGIRTALNKPVCLIKDDITAEIPFDTTIINNHTYSCALSPWTLEKEIDRLTQHIEDSLTKSNGFNSLWKYFSLSATAHPPEKTVGVEGKIEYLNMQMEALRNLVEIKGEMKNRTSNISESFVLSRLSQSLEGIKYDLSFFKPGNAVNLVQPHPGRPEASVNPYHCYVTTNLDPFLKNPDLFAFMSDEHLMYLKMLLLPPGPITVEETLELVNNLLKVENKK